MADRPATRVAIAMRVNGDPVAVVVDARRTLADTLREDFGLTGTHLGCEQGVCGACTVLLDGLPVRSCLVFAVQADDHDVRTVEGLAPTHAELHPIQEAFSACHALQCGYCTPGFMMLAVGLLEENPDIDDAMLREALSANLCRCTGYQNIFAAVQRAAEQMRGQP